MFLVGTFLVEPVRLHTLGLTKYRVGAPEILDIFIHILLLFLVMIKWVER